MAVTLAVPCAAADQRTMRLPLGLFVTPSLS